VGHCDWHADVYVVAVAVGVVLCCDPVVMSSRSLHSAPPSAAVGFESKTIHLYRLMLPTRTVTNSMWAHRERSEKQTGAERLSLCVERKGAVSVGPQTSVESGAWAECGVEQTVIERERNNASPSNEQEAKLSVG